MNNKSCDTNQKSELKKLKLDSKWKCILDDYEPLRWVGSGSYGQVIKAKCRQSGKSVAIKLLENVFRESTTLARYVLREL